MTGETDDAPPALSARAFALALGISLGIFLLLNPIWEAADVSSWDQNIWWSYAAIPLLVAALLAWEHKLVWGAFVLETMKLGLVKFGITFVLANTIWAVWGPPGSVPGPATATVAEAGAGVYLPQEAPEPRLPDPATLGSLAGRLLDGAGRPAAGWPLAIVAGLDSYRFAPPRQPLRLVNDGTGFEPSLSIAQVYQPLVLSGSDGVLHSAVFSGAHRFVLNHPVIPGEQSRLMFPRARGMLSLVCSVHGEGEHPARVLVVEHPFATITDGQGRFRLPGVPAGRLVLATWSAAGVEFRRELVLGAGESQQLSWRLGSE